MGDLRIKIPDGALSLVEYEVLRARRTVPRYLRELNRRYDFVLVDE